MTLYALIINYTIKDTQIKIDPLCGVFSDLETVKKAIEELIKDNPDINHKNFEIEEIQLDQIYYDF